MEFEVYRLGNIITLINGRAYLMPELQDSGKYRIVRVGNFSGKDEWFWSDMELDEDKYCKEGDLLYKWACNFGPEIWKEEKVIYHYHIWKLLCNEDYIDKKFAYYYLQWVTPQWLGGTNGTTMVHITKQSMEKKKIFIPKKISTQKKIVSILSKYDDLIENNNKRIKLLEQMAEELYKEWFVRFRNPLCIRNKFGRVGDICVIKSGFAYKSSDWQQEGIPVVKIKDIVDGYVNIDELDAVPPEVAAKAKNFNLNEMDLVIAMTGATIGKIGIVFKPGLSTNQRVGKIFSNKNYGNLTPFLFCFFRQQSIVETVLMYSGASSAQPNISGEMLQKINIPFSKELIEIFNNKCRPLFLEIIAFKNKNENLMKQRNSLLPRLMSRKIDLEDKEVI